MITYIIDSKIKIDRLKLGGLGITFELFLFFKEIILIMKDIIPDSISHKSIITTIEPYSASITYYNQKNKMVLRIEAGSTKNSFCYVTWEFIPKNMKKSALKQFIDFIEFNMGSEPMFTYRRVYEIGKVTLLELAYDLKTPDIRSLIFWKPKTRKGEAYTDKNTGDKGSIRIGSKTSDLYFFIYDKSKQLREIEQHTSLINYTRIEARLSNTNLTLSELAYIKSPFPNLHIAIATDCKDKWQEPEWLAFIEKALELSHPVAISSLDEATRRVFNNRLKECTATFWKPEGLLSELYKETLKFHPMHI